MHNLNWMNGTVLELAIQLVPANSPKKKELISHISDLLDLSATGKIVASAGRYRRLVAVYDYPYQSLYLSFFCLIAVELFITLLAVYFLCACSGIVLCLKH